MGQMTMMPINPIADAMSARAADAKELGQLIGELELQLLELRALLEREGER